MRESTQMISRSFLPCLLSLAFVACDADTMLEAREPVVGELLISQLYTSGAAPDGGTDHYFSDQFIELVNTAEAPLDLSGIRIADVYGAAGEINSGMLPDSFRVDRPSEVVMSSVWRLPDGTRLEPGQTLTIAQDGTNHRPFSKVDLSAASFESFVADSERDVDYPTVPNLESVVYNAGFDWLMTVFGPSVVVLDATTELGEMTGGVGRLPTVPVTAVLDGVDTLMDADSEAFKRLPDAVDAGFTWSDGPYTGMSVQRRRTDDVWQDTNDSSADFERAEPRPTQSISTGEVYGAPSIELGTGSSSYEPLADGDSVELVSGIQGGWHINVSVWCDGFEPDGTTLVYDAVTIGAEPISFITQAELVESSVLPADVGWYRVGDRLVLDIGSGSDIVGQDLVMRVTAALGGTSWSAERTVRVVDDQR
ncbi:MAG: hypothetical protein ACJATT_005451 [Myxococcota bacterium]|jgi:hypothetical protein